MKKLKDYAPILVVLCCAALFGILLACDVLDVHTIPDYVQNNKALAVVIVLAFFTAKGISGVILYDPLIIVVSLIFPLWEALAINSVGTAVALSISYAMGSLTGTESLDSLIVKHPKVQKYVQAAKTYGFIFCFAIHMMGLSMEVLGILFGLLRIGFWRYLISSWLAILPGMICFTIMGSTWNLRSPVFWIVLVIDAGLITFGAVYTKRKVKEKC